MPVDSIEISRLFDVDPRKPIQLFAEAAFQVLTYTLRRCVTTVTLCGFITMNGAALLSPLSFQWSLVGVARISDFSSDHTHRNDADNGEHQSN